MYMHMAMAAIPYFLEFCIMRSIDGSYRRCQIHAANLDCILYDNFVLCHNIFMTAPRSRVSRVFTISFPEELAKEVIAVADEESRNISELFREAFRTYRVERIHRTLDRARAEAAARAPEQYSEDAVETFVDEIRSERYAQRKPTA